MSAKKDIAVWVSRYCRSQRLWRWGFAGLSLLAGLVAVTVTWWVIYFLLRIFFSAGATRIVVTWLVMVAIFFIYVFADARDFDQLELESPERAFIRRKLGPLGRAKVPSLAALPELSQTIITVAASILLCGPLLIFTAVRFAWEGHQLGQLDTKLVAKVLMKLGQKDQKIPLQQFLADFPDQSPGPFLQQLHLIEGIMIHGGKDGKIYIADSLKTELIDIQQ